MKLSPAHARRREGVPWQRALPGHALQAKPHDAFVEWPFDEFRAIQAYLRAVPLLIDAGVAPLPQLLFGGPKLATHRRYPGAPMHAATLLMLAAAFHQQDTLRLLLQHGELLLMFPPLALESPVILPICSPTFLQGFSWHRAVEGAAHLCAKRQGSLCRRGRARTALAIIPQVP
jgi:hypothetical protein